MAAVLLHVLQLCDKALALETGSAGPAAQPVGTAVRKLRLNSEVREWEVGKGIS